MLGSMLRVALLGFQRLGVGTVCAVEFRLKAEQIYGKGRRLAKGVGGKVRAQGLGLQNPP